jgi:hypothetical protein
VGRVAFILLVMAMCLALILVCGYILAAVGTESDWDDE